MGIAFRRFALITLGLILSGAGSAWAQNENETVGFQTNHIFESGAFGENIDVLNGGLNLTIPIGPSYQVSQNLKYQLQLAYASKIWDHSTSDGIDKVYRRGSFGLGFTLGFGRIYKDVKTGDGGVVTCRWLYVSGDGNEHELETTGDPCTQIPNIPGHTTDTTFLSFDGISSLNNWNGQTSPVPILTMGSSDGRLKYTFGHFVQVMSGTEALNRDCITTACVAPSLMETMYNRDFGGWYVTRIEDLKSASTSYVDITYDEGFGHSPGYSHAIKKVRDSLHRTIVFTNECATVPNTQICQSVAVGANAADRVAVRTASISMPAFKASTVVEDGEDPAHFPTPTMATFNFSYLYASVNNVDVQFCLGHELNCPQTSVNVLTQIQYPEFVTHAGTPPRYTMSFGYGGASPLLYGEMTSRTLPTGATVYYYYDDYYYSYGNTRQIVRKQLDPNDGTTPVPEWQYTREALLNGTSYTNPKYVTVKDPFGNDTVYYYAGSYANPAPPNPPPPPGTAPDLDDGYTPEWDDGVNTRVEYYEGTGGSRRLIRAETHAYQCDEELNTHKKLGTNNRMFKQATIFQDDGGRQAGKEYRIWNNKGLWRETVETGDDIVGTRITHTDYLTDSGDSGVYLYREVSDGSRPLSRSDFLYDGNGNRILSIDRATLPVSIGTARSLTAADGDSIAVTIFDTSNNPIQKNVSDVQGFAVADEVAGSVAMNGDPKYRVAYGWQSGAYLVSKQFISAFGSNTPFGWKAIDRERDGNTGLIYKVKDTAGIETNYSYDSLGRVKDINPSGSELPTQIEYVTATNTSVRQGTAGTYDCGTTDASDFTLSCYTYDKLGRLIKTQKRPAVATSSGYAYQRVSYGIDGRETFRTEWLMPADTVVGTTLDYGDPATYGQAILRPQDPFGRAGTIETADGKRTQTTYLGNSSVVTVKGLLREDGTAFDSTTSYFRDTWGRLLEVLGPEASVADATYEYDLRDNLVGVELRNAGTGYTQTRSFEFDALNRLHVSNNPESGSEVVTAYDVLGGIREKKDASGNLTRLGYDRAGRLSTVEWQAYAQPGNPIVPPVVLVQHNTYDDAAAGHSGGRLTKVESYDDAGLLVHTRALYYQEEDLPGRLSKEDNLFSGWPSGASAPVLYDYNNFGFVSRLDYPEGPAVAKGAFAVQYTYSNGWPTQVMKVCKAPESCTPTAIVSATYNTAGGINQITDMPGTTNPASTIITPDTRGRPSRIEVGPWSGSAFTSHYYDSGTYNYDGAGNIAAIGPNHYGYDGASRLVAATDIYEGTTRRQTFGYDAYGNMTEKVQYDGLGSEIAHDLYTVTDQTTGWNTNRMLSHQVGGQLLTVKYDPRGNLLQEGYQIYEFDGRNRLFSMRPFTQGSLPESVRYAYEGSGNRAIKEDVLHGLLTYYVRDGSGRLLSEFRKTAQGAYTPEWVKHEIYLGDRLVAFRENQLPPPPYALRGTAQVVGTQGQIDLTWNPSPADGTVTTKYRLYRSLNTTPPAWTQIIETASTSYTNTVTKGTWYKYTVAAVDPSNNISYGSDVLTIRAGTVNPIPASPTGLMAKAESARVTLAWTRNLPTDNIAGYHVYRGSGGSAVRLTQLPLTHPSFVDQGLVNGTTYTYSVSAVNSLSMESARGTEVQSIPNDYAPPGTPIDLRVSAACDGSSKVALSWLINGDSDGVAAYVLYRSPVFAGGFDSLTLGIQDSYVDTDTVADATYSYWLKTRDSHYNMSEASLHVAVRTRVPAGTVLKPEAPYAKAGDGSVMLRISTPNLPASVHDIRIYRKRNVDLNCDAYTLLTITIPPPPLPPPQIPSVILTDASLVNDIAYDYAVSYVDSFGRESAFSAPALATPVGAPWGYRECVEKLGSYDVEGTHWQSGAIKCEGTNDFRRLDIRWNKPEGVEYQPLTATNADGTLGYVTGYRIYRYKNTSSVDASHERGFLAPMLLESGQGKCIFHPDVACLNDRFCPSGDACTWNGGARTCSLDPSIVCHGDIDCAPSHGNCSGSVLGYCNDSPDHKCIHCTHNDSDHTCSNPTFCHHNPDHTCSTTIGVCQTAWGKCTLGSFAEYEGVCEGTPTHCGPGWTNECNGIDNVDNAHWKRRCLLRSGRCVLAPANGCVTSADCLSGDRCVDGACTCNTNVECPVYYSCRDHECVQNGDLPTCEESGDCLPGYECKHLITDPYEIAFKDSGADGGVVWGDARYTGNCVAAKAVHKVFADGQWMTVESGFSENVQPDNLVYPKPCVDTTIDVCNPIDFVNPWCPDPGVEPPIVIAPVTTVGPGTITVTWDAPGACEPATPIFCDVSQNACVSPEQYYCHIESSDGLSGHCYLKSPILCSVNVACPVATPALGCVSRETDIDGYFVYAIDRAIGQDPLAPAEPELSGYHARRPFPVARTDKGTRTYTMAGVARYLSGSTRTALSFRIATYDRGGRISRASSPSSVARPLAVGGAVEPPGSAKISVWQTYDALYAKDGVKVTWLPGAVYTALSGYRLWKSGSEDGPYCALIPLTDPGTGALSIACKDASQLAPSEVTTTKNQFIDAIAIPGQVYYYKVTTKISSPDGESAPSPVVAGKVLPRVQNPLSPPISVRAEAPRGTVTYNGAYEYAWIFLSWCLNPPQENVTSYKVYRATTSMGPFTSALAELPPLCMDGRHRCEIIAGAPLNIINACPDGQTPPPPNCCQRGVGGGNCKVVDTTALQSTVASHPVYYYVVTAVRGSGSSVEESPFSVENQGRPNYSPVAGQSGWLLRTDVDDFPELPCGGEVSILRQQDMDTHQLADHSSMLTGGGTWPGDGEDAEDRAPYRIIGDPVGATPMAIPRFLFYHLDHLGTPRVITDETGHVAKDGAGVEMGKHHYMPFGEEIPSVAQGSTNKLQFTGHERDPETNFDYMLARYYSSSLGRFMAVDPAADSPVLENPQTWNRYAYVANNPINRIDPDGRKDKRSEQDKKVTEDKDVKGQTREAWKESNADAAPEDRQEVGFAVVEGGSCTDYETTEPQTQGDPTKVDMDVPAPPGTVATVHTHPLGNAGFTDEKTGEQKQAKAKPGDGDRTLAKDTKAPAYVVSKNKMYRVDPSTGKVSTVLSGQEFKDYMGQKK